MLASIIKVNTAEIAFKTQPLPESIANMPKKAGDPDVILPLLFEADMKITVQSKECTVTLRAPGTVCGEFLIFEIYNKIFFDLVGIHLLVLHSLILMAYNSIDVRIPFFL